MYKLLKLNLARNSLRYILRTYNIKEIYVPYYLCDVIRHSIIKENCKQCLLCAPFCPDSSIPVTAGKRADFDLDHCKGCGICSKVCPKDAITMKEE